MMEYIIKLIWDDEAKVWIAQNNDIPIVLESESVDMLIKRVREAVPEMIEMNNLEKPGAIVIRRVFMKMKKLRRVLATALSAAMVLTGMSAPASAATIEELEDMSARIEEVLSGSSEEVAGVEDETVEETALTEDVEKSEEKTEGAGEHTLWLVGDSTVCSFTDKYYLPRYGYGTQIDKYIDDTYTVNNLALSGRSSKSFLSESNYTKLFSSTEGMKADDILVIGFGHNDEKTEEARYTNPNGDWQTEGSFAKSLYDNYVKKALDKNAKVILCTPICRRETKDGVLKPTSYHVTEASGNYEGGDYAEAIRKLGRDKDIPVVDLTQVTKDYYTEIGPGQDNSKFIDTDELGKAYYKKIEAGSVSSNDDLKGTLYMHAWTKDSSGSVDSTHLNIYGAHWVAHQFALAVKNTASPLKDHITATDAEVQMKDVFLTNPDYTHKIYTAPSKDEKSSIWKDFVNQQGLVFRGTVFGDTGGAISSSYAGITIDDANKKLGLAVTAKDTNNVTRSKISKDTDGILMYFYQLPATTKFKFSANAVATNFGEADDNNSAFGLMARDDIYIDVEKDKTIVSDYVVAGTRGNKSQTNCFYRKDGELFEKNKLSSGKLETGKTYKLQIEYNGDGYSCKIGDEETQSGGYDFQLTRIDEAYQYVGMFVAKSAAVTYSNIELLVENKAGSYVAAGSPEDDVTQVPVEKVTLDTGDFELEVGKTKEIKAKIEPEDAAADTIEWKSKDEKIATVKDGVVTGVAAGKTTIIATAGGVSASVEVTVKGADDTASGNTVQSDAIKAKEAFKGAVNDSIGVTEVPKGKKRTGTLDLSKVTASGNTVSANITLTKGDKVALTDYKKKSITIDKETKKLIAVNGKGILTAKKAAENKKFTYELNDGKKVELTVTVIEPRLESISGNATIKKPEKLAAELPADTAFSLKLTVPLVAKVTAESVKNKGSVEFTGADGKKVADNSAIIYIGTDGALYISGKTASKGSVKVPFMCYGKKYTVKIKVK